MPSSSPEIQGLIHSIETCGTVDGPGIRFVVFTSGCSLRCRYCHNPDTSYQRHGVKRSVTSLLEEISRYIPFLKASGGVTLSGGDPLFQPAFTRALLQGCRDRGLHTCLDTSGHLGENADDALLSCTDMVLLDIKGWDPSRYRLLTGGDLRPTLDFAERLSRLGKPVWLRYVLVPGLTDDRESVLALSRYAAALGNVERVDVLPFHQMGQYKWQELGLDYTLADTSEPSFGLAEEIRTIFRENGFPGKVH